MAIKLVVFDMAGTTIEDNDNVHEALINGFKRFGYSVNREDANSVMGYPKPVAIRTLLEEKFKQKDNIGEAVSNIHGAFVAEMIAFYKTNPAVKAKKNAEETFRQLRAKGIKVCIDTGFSRDIADTIIERLEWNKKGLLDLSVTSDEVNNGRPYPDMIFKAMKDLNISTADEVAKVGDTISDLKEGNGAKCKYVIGITTGAYTRTELETETHTHLVDDLLEVVDIATASQQFTAKAYTSQKYSMKFPTPLRSHFEKGPSALTALFAAIVAFCTYSCMYAFRKPFTAATFDGLSYAGVDLKILLVIAQLIGYTLSKFLGIRIVSEMKHKYRAISIIGLILFAGAMLCIFPLVPTPYNIFFMFLNGVPLGMVWGLVFSYIEGRRATEFMGSVLAISFIFSSGFVKSVGKWLMNDWHVNQFWMPAATGAIFALPMIFFVFMLEQIPDPSALDIASRTERLPMSKTERREFVKHFLPGIIVLVLTYVLLSIIRDFRDNFSADIWKQLGNNDAAIFTATETPISVAILACMSLIMLVRNNFRALQLNHYMVITGFVITGLSTYAYMHLGISAKLWMILNGLGLYLGYIPFNVVFFERLIASARKPANVGFLIYIADSFGYLGSIFLLLFKNFGNTQLSYANFFIAALYMVSVTGIILTLISLLYFNRKIPAENPVA